MGNGAFKCCNFDRVNINCIARDELQSFETYAKSTNQEEDAAVMGTLQQQRGEEEGINSPSIHNTGAMSIVPLLNQE